MNLEIVAGKWKQFRGKLKSRWGELTDDELESIQGDLEQLAGLLQTRYGYAKERAEAEAKEALTELEIQDAAASRHPT